MHEPVGRHLVLLGDVCRHTGGRPVAGHRANSPEDGLPRRCSDAGRQASALAPQIFSNRPFLEAHDPVRVTGGENVRCSRREPGRLSISATKPLHRPNRASHQAAVARFRVQGHGLSLVAFLPVQTPHRPDTRSQARHVSPVHHSLPARASGFRRFDANGVARLSRGVFGGFATPLVRLLASGSRSRFRPSSPFVATVGSAGQLRHDPL